MKRNKSFTFLINKLIPMQNEDVSMIEAELPAATTQELNNKPSMQIRPEDKDGLDRKQSNSKKSSA